jgi:hypothetical protein
MKSIKELFSVKKSEETITKPKEGAEEDREQIRITYYQSGFAASVKATGGPIVFKACLQNLYHSFEDQCRKQKDEQERLKQPYREEQEKHKIELKKFETGLSIHEKKEDELNKNIENLKQEIVEVRKNPENYIEGIKGLTAQFYIGLALLLPITLYLLVFYVSASYSAFFKEFSDDSLTAAIFDKDAFTNAFSDSWLEGLLVMTIPFVFMGLGFVIHMYQKNISIKNTIRLISLFTLTFLFDGLLAYIIEKKIYDFNKTPDSPLYNLKIALGEAEFWMIIFAGFVVYVIWGLVFDFVMKEHEKLDAIKIYIRSKKEEIKNIEKQLVKVTHLINDFKNKIIEEAGKISLLQSKIDGFVFPIKEYLNYHNQYKEGWFQAIGTEIALAINQKQELLLECENTANQHLESLDLVNPDFQHLVYSKN